ncbi:NADH dehydrogenase [ubiquinone] 1 alpha subcomplex subunit 8 [Neocloeon triangulifer]|uniref:NADH dehydrogenase [ubiquinone] 1 alpha subcomplex subunit 8 n=1 Tax=Neocloeon triangulifer TaxID=2078957 RepID=UPI00286F257E|nr:NADH dehydrogenase [ubiquinone] 1 alpha subcomplex subunit 8 [Neocloeon triangulifer]
MVVTNNFSLPTEKELDVQEVNLSSSILRAGAFQLGKHCESQNNEFILCRTELKDPRKCIEEGKAVTSCALDFFRKMKKACREELEQYATCLERSSCGMDYQYCRQTQGVYDKCVLDNFGIERPEFGYYCKPKVHDSKRPKPAPEPPKIYPDSTPGLPEDTAQPPAKYGHRFYIW